MKQKNKIHNLRSLYAEKMRLQNEIVNNETDLKIYSVYFQSNYKSIIWEKINPFKDGKGDLVSLIFNELLPLIAGTGIGSGTTKLFSKGLKYGLMKAGAGLVSVLRKAKDKKAKKAKKQNGEEKSDTVIQ